MNSSQPLVTAANSLNEKAKFFYLLLASLFITALVATNLVANKFITLDLGFHTFVISAGVLPYPITFLITDILSEIYGQRRANQVVFVGFFASAFVLLIVWLALILPASSNSPVGDAVFSEMFQSSWRVVAASMLAYLIAQFVDVRLFHFLKKLTNSKHLWIRNNGSTILSQFVDSTIVMMVFFIGVRPIEEIMSLAVDAWSYKIVVALVDTTFIYAAVAIIRSRLQLKPGEEVVI
ncbi:MAG: queuosine precursor transporter [Bacteroidia bacterium]|nr:queuosine precursor transporter [Bacteroidia bacterium]